MVSLNNKIELSIVIVNYKVKEKLFDLIKSIYSSNPKVSYEIIIVDNDEKKSIAKEINKRFSQVEYIWPKKNLGFGKGNNLGVRSSKGKYVFFLNPDTKILANSIDNLYIFLKNNKKVGIVSPLLLDTNLNPFEVQGTEELTPLRGILSFSLSRKIFPKKSILFNKHKNKLNLNSPKEVDVVPGAAMMINKELFEKVGKFDESFFLYFEENDLSKRVKSFGYKLFIIPQSKIVHDIGQSTKNVKGIEKIYAKSRFLYFNKHYGFINAILVEIVLRINKAFFLVLFMLLLALFLRVFNLENNMSFIGDQGWFYLSARYLLIDGKIPLVGITSSHTWLHQGPFWTYMLSIALFAFKFNPLSGALLTATFGVLSTLLIYKIGSELFSKRIGIVAGFLYASSPLIVFFDRMPFDPSIIPFFTILYFYSIYMWINGNRIFFPLAIVLLAVLYNLELATFSLFFPFFGILLYGFYKRKFWVKSILNKKIIIYSVIGFLVTMAPVIVYDLFNGFKQTILFLGWVFVYKPFSFIFKPHIAEANAGLPVVINFLFQNTKRIIFDMSLLTSLAIFGLSILNLLKDLSRKENLKLENPRLLLLIFLTVSYLGILINLTPSDAYLPIVFPLVILLVAIFFDYLFRFRKISLLSLGLLVIIVVVNAYSSFKESSGSFFKERQSAVDNVISLAGGQKYNLIGKGRGSQFRSFTMNYEYLLWYKGKPVSNSKESLKIYILEDEKGIHVSKNE